jgi:16S rRNA (guanine527-N7)-methyltransferase
MLATLRSLFDEAGLGLSQEIVLKIARYHDLLLDWNQRMDLTNVSPEDIPVRHYLDSLLPLKEAGLFPAGAKIIDVGTGAGFPGLMLAIARGDMQVTLLDSLKKRCDFLLECKWILALPNVTILHVRAEDAARDNLRETFDRAVARAVAPMNVLAEYLLPFVKVGGFALCWKGPKVFEEMEEGARACQLLGGEIQTPIFMPLKGEEHYIVPIAKVEETPKKYPRKARRPSKNPLGQAD